MNNDIHDLATLVVAIINTLIEKGIVTEDELSKQQSKAKHYLMERELHEKLHDSDI